MKNRNFLYAVSLLMQSNKDDDLRMNLTNGIGTKEYIFKETLECIKNINSNKFKDCIKMLTLFDVIKEVEEVFGAFSLNFQEKLINIKDAETLIGMEKLKEIVSNFI